ncbi:hypothetical protein J1N35_000015 [Gossypium stocksii]|uniref:S-acyltransferase n=1 Tax=Gossypium stocksii TaxID=47602 RepID=A0A9D3WEY2_9ROSI|nr:hypothetical protein J1N35_000015 [Gossypium stocksii]
MYVVLPPHGSDPAVGRVIYGFTKLGKATIIDQKQQNLMLINVGDFWSDLVLLLLTSGGDPGIISRNAHRPEPEAFGGNQDCRFFFKFVFSTTLLCMYVFGLSWVYIRRIMASEETTTWRAMIQTPTSIVLIVYTFISMWFVGGLTAFHLYLISTNQMTWVTMLVYIPGGLTEVEKVVAGKCRRKLFLWPLEWGTQIEQLGVAAGAWQPRSLRRN